VKVAVTGGSGFIGSRLISELVKKDFSVRALSRNKKSKFLHSVEIIHGDLSSSNCPIDLLLKDCDILFHCAGDIKNIAAMNSLHVGGTKNLLDVLTASFNSTGKKIRWIQLSSVGVYGPSYPKSSQDRIVTENSPALPRGEYEISKYLSDQIVEQAGRLGIVDYTILRPSNVVGCDMRSSYLYEFIRAIHKRLFFYIGSEGAVATYVHVDDVVKALVLCATNTKAINQVFNLSSDCSIESLVNEISLALSIPAPKLRIGESITRNMQTFLSMFVKTPLTIPRIDSLVSRTRYPSDKINADLNFTYSKKMPISMREIVKNYLDKTAKNENL